MNTIETSGHKRAQSDRGWIETGCVRPHVDVPASKRGHVCDRYLDGNSGTRRCKWLSEGLNQKFWTGLGMNIRDGENSSNRSRGDQEEQCYCKQNAQLLDIS